MYLLNDEEKQRLQKGILAAFAIPFIDDVEDFIWEVIFSNVKGVPLVDTLTNIRSKRLFDVVDKETSIGWSAKALQKMPVVGRSYEVVIQRADIFKKSESLGFEGLTINSPEEDLGSALWKHWYSEKVQKDAAFQGVSDPRVCILMKSASRRTNERTYAYYEDDIRLYDQHELAWKWTNETRTGLQGSRRIDNAIVFRWYPNQKHLFERFILPADAYIFTLTPRRLPLAEMIDYLMQGLDNKP